ncbi:hypothetical protein PRIPAC_83986 [Pristionchus pacificus]|uniref:Uncharacterized protein n=1 Tax=Pristionchus pacificus TaxID=54126 RepID=A0A2A6BT83_PRIPA|nr:hypothetical protein PRIPAC_83986 [Pristionchus pacificus]|eukprot:PDM69013.1 hypothetical protein PRIPAC_47315 [Pristionchus pacificus]
MCAFIFQIIYGVIGTIMLGLTIGSLAKDKDVDSGKEVRLMAIGYSNIFG